MRDRLDAYIPYVSTAAAVHPLLLLLPPVAGFYPAAAVDALALVREFGINMDICIL